MDQKLFDKLNKTLKPLGYEFRVVHGLYEHFINLYNINSNTPVPFCNYSVEKRFFDKAYTTHMFKHSLLYLKDGKHNLDEKTYVSKLRILDAISTVLPISRKERIKKLLKKI